MDWNALSSSIIALCALVLVAYLTHKFTLARERRKRQNELRDKSAAVAEILSLWIRSAYTGEFSNDDRWRLQSVYWKHVLTLDRELLDVLLPRLANQPDAVATNEIIVQARRLILGQPSPDLKAEELNNWPPEEPT